MRPAGTAPAPGRDLGRAPVLRLNLAFSGANLGRGLPVKENALYPPGRLGDGCLAQLVSERLQLMLREGTSLSG
jgi:hypothetical protein